MTMTIRLKLERIIIKPIQTDIRAAILEFWSILTYWFHKNRQNPGKNHT
ncbi:transposase [Vibrio crassostreae]|nr:transposase [Vibrio crassostreae]CAK3269679.1 transposase [Vibrio crassostreae]CAK3407586.1 transposase [Vibrio crassostreae]